MKFLKLFKKNKVPNELPDLATDEIEEKLEDKKLEKHRDIVNDYLKQEEPPEQTVEIKEKITEEPEEIKEPITEEIKPPKPVIQKEGFFDKLQDNLNEEIDDLDKLENWFENKFLPRDIVSEMRG
ncbi:hypothetical protein GF386_06465, partial [Candidatus Pacearchaeota archaeon]|nr:hypothetical protein [Candidatus Pacearchaeota archaeon]MBD3283733.1 hypothetical protein [Candidatus Pacearchaeota archaeon]